MAEVTAAMVAKLREMTGARLMDAKTALVESNGDIEAAEGWLRKKTLDRGGKQGDKAATEGLLGYTADDNAITVVEMTSNTDFVANNPEFRTMLDSIVKLANENKADSAEKLSALQLNGMPVGEVVKQLAGKIGENIAIKRVVHVEGAFGFYIHHNNKEGAIVELTGVSGEKAQTIGKDIAMHIVFAKPQCLTREEVSPELVAKETDIITERLKTDPKNSSKPPEILKKIAQGQLNKFYGEVVLPDQGYYKDGSKTVAQVLKDAGAAVKKFTRFQVGVI
jgi:elongation factor Ts